MKFIIEKKDLHIANIISFIAFVTAFWGIYLIIISKIYIGFLLILIACFFDLFDGYFARKFNSKSELGKFLDSFSDIIIYILPLIIIYLKLFGFDLVFLFTSSIIIFSAIFRLAFFTNKGLTEIDSKKYYIGLPVYFLLTLDIVLFFEGNILVNNLLFLIFAFLMVIDIKVKKANLTYSLIYIGTLFIINILFILGIF